MPRCCHGFHKKHYQFETMTFLHPPLVWFSFINFLNQCADSGKIEKEIVFNDRARTTLKARVTESVRPGVINIMQGWWIDQFKEGSVNHLTHDVINPVQEKVYEPNMHMNDVAVEVVKAE